MSALAEKLVIILGCPASGKTTLARRLAAELSIPMLCKDDIKEGLFDTLGAGDRPWSRHLSEASFAVLARLAGSQLALGRPCILEGNWRPLHSPLFTGMLTPAAPGALQVWCCAEPGEILRRFTARRRHAGHLDASVPPSEIEAAALRRPAFLDLPGRRRIFHSDAPDAFPQLLAGLNIGGL